MNEPPFAIQVVPPSIEYSNGAKEWYKEGNHHREDGPACEYADGNKYWYKDGNLHREDGPAIEWTNGTKSWYLNGVKLSEQEFNNRINSCNGKEVEIDGKTYVLKLK